MQTEKFLYALKQATKVTLEARTFSGLAQLTARVGIIVPPSALHSYRRK